MNLALRMPRNLLGRLGGKVDTGQREQYLLLGLWPRWVPAGKGSVEEHLILERGGIPPPHKPWMASNCEDF